MEAQKRREKPRVAIFTSALMGHLIPLLEFAKRLTASHGFSVTFITTNCHDRQFVHAQSSACSGLDICFVELPEVEIDEDEKEDIKTEISIFELIEKSKSLVEGVLKSLLDSSPLCVFIVDFFCTVMLDVSAELHIPAFVYFPISAFCVCVALYHPTLHSEIKVPFKELDVPVEIPGLPLIPPRDLPDPIQDRSKPLYYEFLRISYQIRKANGFLINTFEDLEKESIKALVEGKILPRNEMPPVYTVASLVSSEVASTANVEDKAGCLKWLDKQPASSVIFVSFGSRFTLSAPQIVELALGLEASGHRFLWVLRSPISSTGLAHSGIPRLLPEGFESRTKDRGLVVTSWAPQIPVLSHPSTGGFLSHCGWNSTLESICFGVPIIAWPLFAEQRTNRFFLVNEIKMAIEAKLGEDGIVRKEEVERAARELMEGEDGIKVRFRAKELKESAERALAEGGSSYDSLAAAAEVWKKK